ncbi:MAG: hypothetical protein LUC27_09010 [Lachnospiraceae bacterium]|nr:hypothetical protein [Lachnospiraceae bacterium]
MKAILKVFQSEIKSQYYISVAAFIFVIEYILNDIYYSNEISSYFVSPPTGIFVVTPIFLLLDAIYYESEADYMTTIRYKTIYYRNLSAINSLLSAVLYTTTVLGVEILNIIVSSTVVENCTIFMSFIAKTLYFSILSLMVKMFIAWSIPKKISVFLVYLFVLVDYVYSYSMGFIYGIVCSAAFSFFEYPQAIAYLTLLYVVLTYTIGEWRIRSHMIVYN